MGTVAVFSLLIPCACRAESAGKLGQPGTDAKIKTINRIVSLAPSNTELIYSLQAAPKLIGVSSYCEYPDDAKKKQKVGSFVSINWERLTTLKPDIVLLVSGQEPLAIQLRKHKVNSLVLKNTSLEDIAKNLLTLGEICDQRPTAEILARNYRKSIAELKETLKNGPRRKVFFCVWPRPIVTVGGDSFLDDVVTACGGTNVAAGIKASYPKCSAEKVISWRPDVLVMPHESKGTNLSATPPWSLLPATKENKTYFLPDREHDFLSRPTLRIFQGLFELAVQLHPEKQRELRKWLNSCVQRFDSAKTAN